MRRQASPRIALVAALTVHLGVLAPSGAWAGPAAATPHASVAVLNEWSNRASALMTAAAVPPFRTPITLALVHLAAYDAVNAIAGGHAAYACAPRVTRPASEEAAAVEAAYRILLAELPSQREALDAARATSLARLPGEPDRSNGLAVGAAAAQMLLARRAGDGRDAVVSYTPGTGPGVWVPTPPPFLPAGAPFLGQVTPFTMRSPGQFRPGGPPPLHSRRYAADYNEVKALGSKESATRTAEQTATGMFWAPLAGTVWPASIRRVSAERGLDLPTGARFQAAAFAAFADGLIACWEAKYHFNFWRPVTAIAEAGSDGNRRTEAAPFWEPLVVTPNFPEYPSGHTCATAAVTHVIEDFFPDDLSIPARNVVSGEERHYARASDVVDEVIEARMLIGVHFRTADEDGAEIGRRIARRIRSRFFKSTDSE